MSTSVGPPNGGDDAWRPPMFDVRLLGVIRCAAPDGESLALGGPKPRAVLARLAMTPGDVVSADALIDVLWGEEPPPTARRSLQAHVAKLRSALGGDEGPLAPAPNGYRLDVPRSAIDVHRIAGYLDELRSLGGNDPARSASLVSQARAMWAYPALADLDDTAWVALERTRLERLEDELADLEIEVLALTGSGDPIAHLERAIAQRPTHEPHWRRLITAYYDAGRQHDALRAYDRAADVLRDELGVDPSPMLQDLRLRILNQDAAPPPGPTCPWKGLVSYQVSDGPAFHGRAHVVDELVTLVQRTSLSVVVGASGAGKSSILRAGLGHRVLTGTIPGFSTVEVISPGNNPMRSLYRLETQPDLLIVDQFEEVFTLTDDERRREDFVDGLVELAATTDTTVLIAVRADFYGFCLSLDALGSILGRHQANVGPLSEQDLRDAIELPAAHAGLRVDPALVEELVGELTGNPGALPLISHALAETWRRRVDGRLTINGYRDAGSVAGALAASAERIHDALGPEDRAELRRLMQRLVEPGSGTAPTRRAMHPDEAAAAGFDTELLAKLIDARLLTASAERVEIAHEALITAWPRLSEWIDDESAGIVLHNNLARATQAWVDNDGEEAELWRAGKLDTAQMWIADSSPTLTDAEALFMAASVERETAATRRARRTARVLRALTTASLVGLVAAIVATVIAVDRSRDADERRMAAETNELATFAAADVTLTDTDRLQIAAALEARTPTFETASLLLESVASVPEILETDDLPIAAVLGNGPSYASGLGIRVARESIEPAWLGVVDGLDLTPTAVPFSPAAMVATGPDVLLAVDPIDHQVVDLISQRPVGTPPDLGGREPAFTTLSGDGAVMGIAFDATPERGAEIVIHRIQTGEVIDRIDVRGEVITELEFSTGSADALLAVVDEAEVHLWRLPGGELDRVIAASSQTSPVTATALNVWTDRLAIGREDGTVETFWREDTTWTRTSSQPLHDGAVTWVEFDADDQLLLTSADNGTVVTWTIDGEPIAGPLAFETRGRTAVVSDIATGHATLIDSRGSTWTWDPRARSGLVDEIGAAPATAPAFLATGAPPIADLSARLDLPEVDDIVVGLDGSEAVIGRSAIRWSADEDLRVPRNGEAPVVAAASSNVLAVHLAGSPDVTLYDAADGGERNIGLGGRDGVVAMSIDKTARHLLVHSDNGVVAWYSLERPDAEILDLPAVLDAHFVGDGLALAATENGLAWIVVGDGSPLLELLGFATDATTVDIDPASGLIATTTADNRLELWDVDSGRRLGAPLSLDLSDPIRWTRFDALGRVVLASGDQTLAVTTDRSRWLDLACQLSVRLNPEATLPDDDRWAGLEVC